MTSHKQITLKIPLDLLYNVWKNRKPNQTLNNRFTELIKQGLEVKRCIDMDAPAIAQIKELIREGKFKAPHGIFKKC